MKNLEIEAGRLDPQPDSWGFTPIPFVLLRKDTLDLEIYLGWLFWGIEISYRHTQPF